MPPFIVAIALTLSFFASQLSASSTLPACQPTPLSVPIEDVTLPNKKTIWGISLALGSPPQNFSFLPSSDNNETYAYGQDGHCGDNSPAAQCTTFRGGQYDARRSSTTFDGASRSSSDNLEAQWVADTIHVHPNVTVPEFTFGLPDKDLSGSWISQAQLGLGRNSSLLKMLHQANKIGSRTYSLFWGLVRGSQAKGSLVLGGFDQSIAGKSENYTASLTYGRSNCSTGMLVTVNDILLNWPNGTDMSIFKGSQSFALQACIAPSFAGLMTIPFSYWSQFKNLVGGTEIGRSFGINHYTMLYEADDVYYGDLTLSIQNGIKIRIQNQQLVVPSTNINKDGEVVANQSVRDIVLNSIQDVNANGLPIIGRLFFTSAYLMVNHDANSFTLWQADPKAANPDIKAVSPSNNVVTQSCVADTTANITNSTTTTAPSSLLIPDNGLSKGSIVGIVVGSVASVALFGAIGFFLLRRRRRTQIINHSAVPTILQPRIEDKKVEMAIYQNQSGGPYEMPSDQMQPHYYELDPVSSPR